MRIFVYIQIEKGGLWVLELRIALMQKIKKVNSLQTWLNEVGMGHGQCLQHIITVNMKTKKRERKRRGGELLFLIIFNSIKHFSNRKSDQIRISCTAFCSEEQIFTYVNYGYAIKYDVQNYKDQHVSVDMFPLRILGEVFFAMYWVTPNFSSYVRRPPIEEKIFLG